MAEQLLDDAQVGAAVEEMGRERVTQRVWGDALGQARDPAQPVESVAQAAHAERGAGVVQEDGRRGGVPLARRRSSEQPAGPVQVCLERCDRRPPEQPDALLAALAEHPDLATAAGRPSRAPRPPAR